MAWNQVDTQARAFVPLDNGNPDGMWVAERLYNRNSDRKGRTLIGNWQEERVLGEDTDTQASTVWPTNPSMKKGARSNQSSVFISKDPRQTLPDSEHFVSTSRALHAPPAPSQSRFASTGPRRRMLEKMIIQEVLETLSKEDATSGVSAAVSQHRLQGARQSRQNLSLVGNGPTSYVSTKAAAEFFSTGIDPELPELGLKEGQDSSFDYIKDAPITLYTAAQGAAFQGTTAASGHNALGRNANFSTPAQLNLKHAQPRY